MRRRHKRRMQHLLLSMALAALAAPPPSAPGAAAPPVAAPPAPPAPPKPTEARGKAAAPLADKRLAEGVLDFRCDSMLIYTKPNRNVCRGHVVLRRGDLLACCESFEGMADDKWAWQSF